MAAAPKGIAPQPTAPATEANVCGFSTAYLYKKALAAVLAIAKSNEHEDLESAGAALSKEIHALRTEAQEYGAYRRKSISTLKQMGSDYQRYRAAKKVATKKVATTTSAPSELARQPSPHLLPKPPPSPCATKLPHPSRGRRRWRGGRGDG